MLWYMKTLFTFLKCLTNLNKYDMYFEWLNSFSNYDTYHVYLGLMGFDNLPDL